MWDSVNNGQPLYELHNNKSLRTPDLDDCEGILGVDVLNNHKGILNLGGGNLDLGGHIIPLDHSSFVSTPASRDPTLVLLSSCNQWLIALKGFWCLRGNK